MAPDVQIPGPGIFEITTPKLEEIVSGKWYFGTDCLECEKRFAILEDDSGGMTKINFVGEGHIRSACPHCGADRMYSTDQISQYQHP